MSKRARSRKPPARRNPPPRNPYAPLARALRAKVVGSRKTYRRKEKHPKKGAGGNEH